MKHTLVALTVGMLVSACGDSTYVGTTAPADSALTDSTLTDSTPPDSALTDSNLTNSTPPDSTLTDSTLTNSTLTDSTLTDSKQTVPAIAAAEADPNSETVLSDTQSLNVSSSFDFTTARTVVVDFDLDQARGENASVSICTEFNPLGDAYDVNYDSCTVRGPMDNGYFQHSMYVTNDIDAVAGVVWFLDSTREPLMQVFPVTSATTAQSSKDRSVLSTDSTPRIVWR